MWRYFGRSGETVRAAWAKSSKLQLQRQLHRPRPANLVQRIEASALAAAPQPVIQGLRRLPEQRRTEVVDGAAKIGVVEDVEHIRARLKREALAEGEPPLQREIDLRSAESAQGISSQISLPRRGNAEGRFINDPSAACVRIGNVERHAGNHIRPLHAGGP